MHMRKNSVTLAEEPVAHSLDAQRSRNCRSPRSHRYAISLPAPGTLYSDQDEDHDTPCSDTPTDSSNLTGTTRQELEPQHLHHDTPSHRHSNHPSQHHAPHQHRRRTQDHQRYPLHRHRTTRTQTETRLPPDTEHLELNNKPDPPPRQHRRPRHEQHARPPHRHQRT